MNCAFLLLIMVSRTNVNRDANSFLEHCFTYKNFSEKTKNGFVREQPSPQTFLGLRDAFVGRERVMKPSSKNVCGGDLYSNSLRRRRNLTSVSNVCEAASRSLFRTNGLNELPEFPFNLIDKSTMGFFNRPIMARTQILVHRWGPRTRISVLFCRRT